MGCKPVTKTRSFFWVPLQVTVIEVSNALSDLLVAFIYSCCVILMQPNEFSLPILRVTLVWSSSKAELKPRTTRSILYLHDTNQWPSQKYFPSSELLQECCWVNQALIGSVTLDIASLCEWYLQLSHLFHQFLPLSLLVTDGGDYWVWMLQVPI